VVKEFCRIQLVGGLENDFVSYSSQWLDWYTQYKKGKVFPYSLPSVGPGADPGVQAVSPQVT